MPRKAKTIAKLEGMPKLDRKLKKIVDQVGAEKVEPIIYEAASQVTSEVQQNVNAINQVSGNLRRSPVTRMMDRRRADQPRPSIAAIDRRKAPHAHLVEFGARGGQMPAQPFFRPGWDRGRPKAQYHIRRGLENLVRRGAR